MKNIPPTLSSNGCKNMREYKKVKRRQLADLDKAVRTYSIGCASGPGYPTDIDELRTIMKRMKQSHSVHVWGR